jgi:hypothetical protein
MYAERWPVILLLCSTAENIDRSALSVYRLANYLILAFFQHIKHLNRKISKEVDPVRRFANSSKWQI